MFDSTAMTIEDFEKLLDREPWDAELRLPLADLCEEAGRDAEAATHRYLRLSGKRPMTVGNIIAETTGRKSAASVFAKGSWLWMRHGVANARSLPCGLGADTFVFLKKASGSGFAVYPTRKEAEDDFRHAVGLLAEALGLEATVKCLTAPS